MRAQIFYRAASAILLCLQQATAFSQSDGTNYRLTETMLDSLGARKVTTVDYYVVMCQMIQNNNGGAYYCQMLHGAY